MKAQNIIMIISLLLSISVSAKQDFSNFDTDRKIYLTVTDHHGLFNSKTGDEIKETASLALCTISFYREKDDSVQLIVDVQDGSGVPQVRKYGLNIASSKPFPINTGLLRYFLRKKNTMPGYTLSEAQFNGEKIESYTGDLDQSKASYFGTTTYYTDEYLNINEYHFKYFERNESGEVQEKSSFTCKTPLLF